MRVRPRRNRVSPAVRGMVRETRLSVDQLIFPLFVLEDSKAIQPINSMPGMFRRGLEPLKKEIEECVKLGVVNFDLFPAVDNKHKDKFASYSLDSNNFYLNAVRELKKEFPMAMFMSDVAMDPYSSNGHDGLVENGQIVIRPINYLALSYDHRIIDGREAVLGLVAMKDALEDPSRLLLDL